MALYCPDAARPTLKEGIESFLRDTVLRIQAVRAEKESLLRLSIAKETLVEFGAKFTGLVGNRL
jgi:hypothetical protein